MDAGKLVKAAATAALASTGDLVHQQCPSWVQAKYHLPDVCETKPVHRYGGHVSRRSIFRSLQQSGVGASLVPNIETVTCPLGEVQSLESPSAAMGFDTTWIVENTSTKSVVLARVTNGIEYSPFQPDKKPMEDPQAILKPGGEWGSRITMSAEASHQNESIPPHRSMVLFLCFCVSRSFCQNGFLCQRLSRLFITRVKLMGTAMPETWCCSTAQVRSHNAALVERRESLRVCRSRCCKFSHYLFALLLCNVPTISLLASQQA